MLPFQILLILPCVAHAHTHSHTQTNTHILFFFVPPPQYSVVSNMAYLSVQCLFKTGLQLKEDWLISLTYLTSYQLGDYDMHFILPTDDLCYLLRTLLGSLHFRGFVFHPCLFSQTHLMMRFASSSGLVQSEIRYFILSLTKHFSF